MSDAVVVAIITGLFAVLGQWLIARGQSKQKKTDDAVREARTKDRLDSLEAKIDIHNGYAERFAEIRTDIAVIKTQIENLYHRMGG